MKTAKTKTKWKRVSVELSPQASDMIDQLLVTGLHGLSRGEVCQRFVDAALRSLTTRRELQSTILELEQRKQRKGGKNNESRERNSSDDRRDHE